MEALMERAIPKILIVAMAVLTLPLFQTLPAQAAASPKANTPILHRGHTPRPIASASAASQTSPLKPGTGPVQNYTKTYAIFWLPPGYTYESGTSGSSSRYISLIERYLSDIGGSTFLNSVTQYYDSANWISNSSTFTDATLDTSVYPVHNGYTYTTDADIQAEVAKAIKARGWPYGLHEQFFVFTAAGILTYAPVAGGWSSNGSTGYCGYHNYFSGSTYGLQNFSIVYANMPGQDGHYPCYARTFSGSYDASGNPTFYYYSPNHDYTVDSMISITSHEQFEMITDPLLYNWRDADGNEIGDKCAGVFGTVGSDTGNATLKGDRYILQGEFSNDVLNSTRTSGCTWYRALPYH
jgi:hypothetical protein